MKITHKEKRKNDRFHTGKTWISMLLAVSMVFQGTFTYAEDFGSEEVYVSEQDTGEESLDQSVPEEAVSAETQAGMEAEKGFTIPDGLDSVSVCFPGENTQPRKEAATLRNLRKTDPEDPQKPTKEEILVQKARRVCGWEESEIRYGRAFDLTIEDAQKDWTKEPVTVKVRLYDERVMTEEEKQEFLPNRQKLLEELPLKNLHVVRLADKQEWKNREEYLEKGFLIKETSEDPDGGKVYYELPTISIEDGVIRFQMNRLSPFVFLIREEAAESGTGSEDFFSMELVEEEESADAATEEPENGEAEEAGMPEKAEIPEEAGSSEETGIPEEAGSPEKAGSPEETGRPEEAGNPEETGIPVETGIPEESGKIEESGMPEEAGRGTYQLSTAGESYEVSLTYEAEANIPEGSELVVEEIAEGDGQYHDLTEKAMEALQVDADRVLSVTLVDLSIAKDGEVIEPETEVGVEISLAEDETGADPDILTQVVSIGETSEVLTAGGPAFAGSEENLQLAEAGMDTVEAGEEDFAAGENDFAVSENFATAGSASYETTAPTMDTVYAIVRTTLRRELLASDGNTYEITVTYDSAAGIPQGAELEVTEITEDSEHYESYLNQTAETLSKDTGSISYARLFDISIRKDGEAIEPASPVAVQIRLKDKETAGTGEAVSVVHFGEETEILDAAAENADEGEVVSFTSEGFSVYAVVYTVDFHWGDYTYQMTGGSEILLSQLFDILKHDTEYLEDGKINPEKFDIDVEDIETVSFSDPTLLEVSRIEGAESIQALADQIVETWHNSEAVESEEETDEAYLDEIEEAAAEGYDGDVSASEYDAAEKPSTEPVDDHAVPILTVEWDTDWLLTSLAPFTSDETLILTLKDGRVQEICVTDAVSFNYQGLTYQTINNNTTNVKVVGYQSGYSGVPTIPATISYNGTTYTVTDLTYFGTARTLKNKNLFFETGMLDKMANNAVIGMPEMVAQMDAAVEQALLDNGFMPGANNGSADQMVWKKAVYNPETNSITYEIKYFQPMKQNQPLDFIFGIDQSGTMCTNDATAYGIRAPRVIWMMALLQRTAYELVSKNGQGYDNKVAFVPWGSTNVTPVGNSDFLSRATEIDAWFQGPKPYSHAAEGTSHGKACDALADAAALSIRNGRTPIVIYMSDFVSFAGSNLTQRNRLKLAKFKTYSFVVFNGPHTDFSENWSNSGAYASDEPAEFMGIFSNIVLDAIGYYMKGNIAVTDTMPDAISDVTATQTDAGGAAASNPGTVNASAGKVEWQLGNQNPLLGSGTVHTETFTAELDDDTIYSGAMPTNGKVTVTADGKEVNSLEPSSSDPDHLHMGGSVRFLLGRMDEKQNMLRNEKGVPDHLVSGIQFSLFRVEDDELIDTYTTVNGAFEIPYQKTVEEEGVQKKIVLLELGKTYILKEVGTSVDTYNEGKNVNDLNDPKLKKPDKNWILTVAANGVVTVKPEEAASQTPNVTIAKAEQPNPARFVLWNEIVVPARLIPLQVKKVWSGGDKRDPVPFTIYGVERDGDTNPGETHLLTAYDGPKAEEANTVKYIGPGNKGFEEKDNGNIWIQKVWVLDQEDGHVFYDYQNNIDLSTIPDGSTFTLGTGTNALTLSKSEWTALDEDGDGRIPYGQSYSYAIEEGNLVYENGWYTPSYSNNATSTTLNIREGNIPEQSGAGDPTWIDYVEDYNGSTSDWFFFELDVWNYRYSGSDNSFNTTAGNDGYINADAEKKEFFKRLRQIEAIIEDNGTYYRVTIPVSGEYDYRDHLNTDTNGHYAYGNALFPVRLPSSWLSKGSVSNDNGLIKKEVLQIHEIVVTFTGSTRKYLLYGDGQLQSITRNAAANMGACDWGPFGPHQNNEHATAVCVYDSAHNTYRTNHRIYMNELVRDSNLNQQILEIYEVKPATPAQTIPATQYTLNSCTLGITNIWNPNSSVPVLVKKDWMNGKTGNALTETQYSSLKKPISFSIMSSDGKQLPIFEESTSNWDSGTTTYTLTGDASQGTWTKQVYVPKFDTSTYDRVKDAAGQEPCEAYQFSGSSLIEVTNLNNTLPTDADGMPQGEWSSPATAEFTAGETVTHIEKEVEKHSDFWRIDFRIKNPPQRIKDHEVILRYDIGVTGRTGQTRVNLGSTTQLGQADGNDNVYLINVAIAGYYLPKNITVSFDGGETFEVPSMLSAQHNAKEYTLYGPGYYNVKNSCDIKEVVISETSTPITLPDSFTFTNTFTPYNRMTLQSTFTDESADLMSTGKIAAVAYTIEGTTSKGVPYSRETVNATAPSTAGSTDTKTVRSFSKEIYVPEGRYTITETAYILNGSEQRYEPVAYTVTNDKDSNGASLTDYELNGDETISFQNMRKVLPVRVQIAWEPTLQNSEDPLHDADKKLEYAIGYEKVGDNGIEPYELSKGSYIRTVNGGTSATMPEGTDFQMEYARQVNDHNDGIPSYSITAVQTQCALEHTKMDAALPDYSVEVSSEMSEGKLIFTITATIRKAEIHLYKIWEGVSSSFTYPDSLSFTLKRSDQANIYGTEEAEKSITINNPQDPEAWAGVFEEIPVLRNYGSEKDVKYILTETDNDFTVNDFGKYYTTYVDESELAENDLQTVRPKDVNGHTEEYASFRLNDGGIFIDVQNAEGPYICKIEETFEGSDGVIEHPFRTLNAAVNWARNNDVITMDADHPVAIQMLVDYEIPKADLVTLNQAKDNITITTAKTSGGVYNFTPTFTEAQGRRTEDVLDGEGNIVTPRDSAEIAILKRGWDGGNTEAQALFYVNAATASLTTTNILFDGEDSNDMDSETGALIQHTGRAVHVKTGSLTVTDGSTFRNFTTPISGGAIYSAQVKNTKIQGSTPSAILFENCRTTGSTNYYDGGGAIAFIQGTKDEGRVEGATFIDCRASSRGGAIYVRTSSGAKTFLVTNCVFDGHEDLERIAATTVNAVEGGAIYIWDGWFSMTDCDFTDCTSSGAGGAVYAAPGGGDKIELIANCTFNGHDTLPDDTVNATSGGAFRIQSAEKGIGCVRDITVTNCRTSGDGGGAYFNVAIAEINGEFNFSNCYTTNGSGGGIYFYPTVTIADTARFTFDNCHAGGSASNSGAMHFNTSFGKDITFTGAKFTDCSAGNEGGCIFINSNSGHTTKFASCEFNGHDDLAITTANAKIGGAISVNDGHLEFVDCSLTNLTATGEGGAIFTDAATSDTLALTRCTINGNDGKLTQDGVTVKNATTGGGVYAYVSSGIMLEDVTFENCQSSGDGGGLYAHSSSVIKETNKVISFTNCYSTGGKGGGAYFGNTATFGKSGTTGNTVTFKDCHDDSTSTANGGGGAWFNSTVTLQSGTKLDFDSCYSASYGGGAYFGGNSSSTLSNAPITFKECYAAKRGGGVYFAKAPTLNNTVSFTGCHTDTAGTSDGGGGAWFQEGVTLNASAEMSFEDCYTASHGGGAWFNAAATVNASADLSFDSCYAGKNGGGAYFAANSAHTLPGVSFTNCKAGWAWDEDAKNFVSVAGGNGGGLYKANNTLTLTDTTFTGCYASANGGAICYAAATSSGTALNLNSGTSITGCTVESGGRGSAIYFSSSGLGNFNGGTTNGVHGVNITGNRGAGAVEVNSNSAILTFSGNVLLYDNLANLTIGEGVEDVQKNMVLDRNTNTVIKTATAGLGADAHIGVYVTDGEWDRHGKLGKQFGTWQTTSVNLEKFTNDRNEELFGVMHPGDNLIYWGTPICKIVDTNGEEQVFATLNSAVQYARANTATAYVDGVCIVQMLVDYEIMKFDVVTLNNVSDNFLFTTAEPKPADPEGDGTEGGEDQTGTEEDDKYYFTPTFTETDGRTTVYDEDGNYVSGDSAETAIFRLGSDVTTALFTVSTSNAFGMSNLIFHGRNTQKNLNGPVLYHTGTGSVTLENVTVGALTAAAASAGKAATELAKADVDMSKSFKGVNGGAIYSNTTGNFTLTDCAFYGCYTTSHGGAIYLSANNANIAETYTRCVFVGCETSASTSGSDVYGGAICGNNGAGTVHKETNVTNCVFTDCKSQLGGAILARGNAVNIVESVFTRCVATRYYGGAIYADHTGTKPTVALTRSTFTGCTAPTGGAISNKDNGWTSLTVSGCTFDGCIANGTGSYINGGAIAERAGNTALITIQKAAAVAADAENGIEAKEERATVFNDCYTARNGGAIWSKSPLTLDGVTINGHTGTEGRLAATTANAQLGGAIYAEGNVTIKDGEIKNCSASTTASGGAINVNGVKTIAFEGSAVVRDNGAMDSSGKITTQKNVVLQQDNNTVIQTTANGLNPDAYIGVFVIDGANYFDKHGKFEQDFGTIGSKTEAGVTTRGDQNLDCFNNDRNGLYGEACPTHEGLIRWVSYLCKLTDADGNLLYKDAEHTQPAVYKFLSTQTDATKVGGFNAAQGTLYTAAGESFEGTEIQLQMLRNYSQPDTDQPTVSGSRAVTMTTAQTTETAADKYIYNRGSDTANTEPDRATITRGADTGSMFTVTGASTGLTTKNIIFNGGNALDIPLTAGDSNGGVINFSGSELVIDEATLMKNSTATNGGMIYISRGTIRIIGGATDAASVRFEDYCATENGGAIYNASSDELFEGDKPYTVYVTGKTVFDGHAGNLSATQANAKNGGAIYVNIGDLYMTGGKFLDCKASENGGTIFDNHRTTVSTDIDTINLVDVEIDGHAGGLAMSEPNADKGGAIYTAEHDNTNAGEGGSIRLYRCRIMDCTANNSGGAIYNGSYRRDVNNTNSNKDEPTVHLIDTIIDGHDQSVREAERLPASTPNAKRGGGIYSANGTLVIEGSDITTSVIKNCTVSTGDNVIGDGGAITHVGGGTQGLTNNNYTVKIIKTTINGHADDFDRTQMNAKIGGGINIKKILTLIDAQIINCSASDTGGAIRTYGGVNGTVPNPVTKDNTTVNMNVSTKDPDHPSTITGNTAGIAGAGIYLLEGAKLNLAGAPNFGGTEASGDNINIVGTGDDAKRQDIYISGYLGKVGGTGENKDDPRLAESLIVTGALNVDKGSIWVGAQQIENEEDNHWDTLKQFARFHADLMTGSGDDLKIDSTKLSDAEVEKIYAAFRNATTSEEYYGMSGDGQTGGVQCIYWEGVQGSRKVILRKVSTTYESLPGAIFTITKGSKTIEGTDINGTENATSFTSGSSGVFYIGMMDYGVYVLHEITVPSGYSTENPYYYVVVDAGGVVMSDPSKDGQAFTTDTAAKSAGDALFKQRAEARKTAATTP